jgi:tetratricopeptide (TPR) repeat protein
MAPCSKIRRPSASALSLIAVLLACAVFGCSGVPRAARAHGAGRTSAAVPSPLAALDLLTDGATALTNDRPELAETLLARYLDVQPDSSMALFLRGVALLDMGRLEEARSCLRKAAALDPDDASGHAVLARVEFELGDLDGALISLQHAVERKPEAAQHWTSLGLLYFELDRWNDAYDALLTAIGLDDEDATAHRALGRLYSTVGEFEMAERAYRTAIHLLPDDVSLWVALGHVLRDLGRSGAARDAYLSALERAPANPWLHANLAAVYVSLHKPFAARPHYEDALTLLAGAGLDEAYLYINYGALLERMGEIEDAVAAYSEALVIAPDLGPAYEALGNLQLQLDRRAAARVSLGRAHELGEMDPDSLVDLALLHEEQGDWEAALRCSRELLEHESLEPNMNLRRARLRVRSKHPEVRDVPLAVELLRSLVEGNLGEQTGSWELLSEALAEMGLLEQAIGAMDAALRVSRPRSALRSRFERERARLVSRLEERD